MSVSSIVEFAKELIVHIQVAIKKVEAYKELSGQEKMDRVNAMVYEFFDNNYDKLKINFIVKAYMKKKIRKLIPVLTQKVYDLIKSYVAGITEKVAEKINKNV